MHSWKRAQGKHVVTRDEGAAIGTLNDFQFDLADRHIYGWRLKGPGMFAPFGGVSTELLLVIGRDVAIVQSEKSVEWSNAGRNTAEGRAWAGDYRGTTVVDQRGRAMGSVQDFVFDELGARLTGFVIQGNLLLPLDDRVRMGPAAVIAQDQAQAVAIQDLPESPEDRERWWDRITGRAKKDPTKPADEEPEDEPVTWPPEGDE
jgi:sporulation protein YlmC with PRC-barrel domain